MAYVGKMLASGYVRPIVETVFEATSSTIITYARFFNVNAGPEDVDIYVTKADGERIQIYRSASLASNAAFNLLSSGEELVFSAGDRLEASTDDENSVGYLICGAEFE